MFYHSHLFERKRLQVSSETRVCFSECAQLTFAPGPGITCSPGFGSRLSSATSAVPSSAWKAPSVVLAATHPSPWSWANGKPQAGVKEEEEAHVKMVGPFPWLASVCAAWTLHLLFHALLAGQES